VDGVLVQVSVSGGGVPKRAVAQARLAFSGVEGDRQADRRYHGGPNQAVCLFDAEKLEELAAESYAVRPGSLGENLTTRGLDYRAVRIGDVYRIGDEATIQVTKPRVPCTTIQVYGEPIIKRLWGPTVPWGESGFYGRVLSEGLVRPGDVVSLEREGPEAPPAHTRKISFRS
jgi:MOSC domain-containing protein YiiM